MLKGQNSPKWVATRSAYTTNMLPVMRNALRYKFMEKEYVIKGLVAHTALNMHQVTRSSCGMSTLE